MQSENTITFSLTGKISSKKHCKEKKKSNCKSRTCNRNRAVGRTFAVSKSSILIFK